MTRTRTQCIWFDKSITKEQTHVSIIFLRVDIKKNESEGAAETELN